MPAQKRSSEHLDDESNNDDENNYQNPEVEGEEGEDEDEEFEEAEEENVVENEEEEEEEADGDVEAEAEQVEEEQGEQDSDEESGASNDEEKPEFISVKLQDIRKEVQCPICLGIIRKTRTVMECLHRFCRECIDKSMRMGNNECPACRTHCASRRSLRDDPRYDAIIAALYPDIDKYEEEELAFRDEEKTRNKQIQASIAQTFRRQTEALGRRRTTAKAVAAFMRRSQGHYRRGRSSRNSRATELQSDIEEDGHGNEGGRDSSSADERSVEVKPKRCRRWGGPRFSQPSSGATNADDNDDLEVSKESAGASSVFTGNPEVLAWGGGGVRSSTRYGSVSNGKNGRAGRISKLVDSLRNSEENDDKMVVHLTLVPFDEKIAPTLEEPYLCCDPTFSIERICEYVAPQTKLKTEEVEILLVAEPSHVPCLSLPSSEDDPSEVDQDSLQIPDDPIPRVDPLKDNLQILEIHETLSQLLTRQPLSGGHLVLAYRQRTSS